jgi:hypothetical protein
MKIEKIEVLKITNDEEPEVYFVLPSGYKNVNIRVYESAYEELESVYVDLKKYDAEKKEMKIGF